MNNLTVCINAVLPIFIIICIGYFCRQIGMLEEKDIIKFNSVAFRVFLPVLLFNNIYTSDISSAFRPKLILFSLICVFLAFFSGLLYAVKCIKERPKKGVVIQGIYRSNTAIIGLPLAISLTQGGDVSCVAVLSAVMVPVFNVLAVVSLEIFGSRKADYKDILKNIAKNPLIIGSMLGIIAMLLKIKLPTAVEKVLKDMSGVASPLQLFLLGAFLQISGMKKNIRELIVVNLGKLILVPGLVFLAAILLGFRGIEIVALIAIFATSTAVNSFTMAQQMNGDAELAGEIVVTTSFFCSFTIFGWSLLLKTLGYM